MLANSHLLMKLKLLWWQITQLIVGLVLFTVNSGSKKGKVEFQSMYYVCVSIISKCRFIQLFCSHHLAKFFVVAL